MKVHLHEHQDEERRCPICHDALGALETWSCPACATVHHLECARENGRCAELGCSGRIANPNVNVHATPRAHAHHAHHVRHVHEEATRARRSFWARLVLFAANQTSYAGVAALTALRVVVPAAAGRAMGWVTGQRGNT